MAFTIASFLGFLQIDAVGSPIVSMAFILSLLGYYLAFRAKSRFPRYASQLAFLMTAFSSFSVASLLSLLLPNSWWPVKLIIFIVVFCELFYPKIKSLFDKYGTSLFWGEPLWSNGTTTRHLLPMTHRDCINQAEARGILSRILGLFSGVENQRSN